MGFSHTYKTLRSGNTYDWLAHSEMSACGEEVAVEVAIDANERDDEASARFFPDMIDEKNKVNL